MSLHLYGTDEALNETGLPYPAFVLPLPFSKFEPQAARVVQGCVVPCYAASLPEVPAASTT